MKADLFIDDRNVGGLPDWGVIYEMVHNKWSYVSEPHKDMYYRAFLNGISYRESCYHCKFAQPERVSDITIGDFWGLQDDNAMPKQGGSVVLPSTDKGIRLLKAIESKLALTERNVEEASNNNAQLCHPVKENLRVKFFRLLYLVLPFDNVVALCIADCKLKSLLKRIC